MVSATILCAIKDGRPYGLDIMDATGLPDGTVYKTLHRMERRGLLRGNWEDAEIAEAERRPRRRYYEVTAEGDEELPALLTSSIETPASMANVTAMAEMTAICP